MRLSPTHGGKSFGTYVCQPATMYRPELFRCKLVLPQWDAVSFEGHCVKQDDAVFCMRVCWVRRG